MAPGRAARPSGSVPVMTEAVEAPFTPERPSWAPLTLVAFVGLVVCTNVAGATWAKLLESSPETLLVLSSRNRYLVLALGADVSPFAYWGIGFIRIASAFLLCHLIGRAYSATALTWFIKYLGVTPEALEQFDRMFYRAEWFIIPFFAGSNLIAALSGIHHTPLRRLLILLSIGIIGRLLLIWWLARDLRGATRGVRRLAPAILVVDGRHLGRPRTARERAELPQGRCRLIQLAYGSSHPPRQPLQYER